MNYVWYWRNISLQECRSCHKKTLSPLIASALRHLQKIWASRGVHLLSVTAWAEATGCSPEHLSRTISKALGLPPREFMQALRMQKALHLLRNASFTVEHIAQLLGFAHQNQLARLSRKIYGKSPKELRNWMRENNALPVEPLQLAVRDIISLFWTPETLRVD